MLRQWGVERRMFGFSTELITKGKLATVKSADVSSVCPSQETTALSYEALKHRYPILDGGLLYQSTQTNVCKPVLSPELNGL